MIIQCEFAGWAVSGGVSQTMAAVLSAVQDRLVSEHAAAGHQGTLAEWIGLDESVRGARGPGQGNHSSGNAVDVNYTTAPYIATRSGATYGGEHVAAPDTAMRQRAVEACDRAVAFGEWGVSHADLSVRHHDTIEQTYDRFRLASDALVYYFAGTFWSVATRIDRPPIAGVHDLPDGDPAFAAIGSGELAYDPETAIGNIQLLFDDPGWQAAHPGWAMTAEQQFWQMLRDYELVRTPMLFGKPSEPVRTTRNPARGFLPFRREFVVAMVEEGNAVLGVPPGVPQEGGVRWGASDFGAASNGDIQHFDLGYQASYE